jgi:hypothetical protein
MAFTSTNDETCCPGKLHLISLEAISKPQVAFAGKAKADEKAQHTREYVSIVKRLSTQPSSVIWGFEMASMDMEG